MKCSAKVLNIVNSVLTEIVGDKKLHISCVDLYLLEKYWFYAKVQNSATLINLVYLSIVGNHFHIKPVEQNVKFQNR